MFLGASLLFFVFIEGCESRTLNIVVRHTQHFEVKGDEPRTHITLPAVHERQLELDQIQLGPVDNDAEYPINVDAVEHDADIEDVHDHRYDDTEDDETDKYYSSETESDSTTHEHDMDKSENVLDKFGGIHVFNDISADEVDLESVAGLNKIYSKLRNTYDRKSSKNGHVRVKRSTAHEQWRESLPGHKPNPNENDEPDHWLEVTDDDLQQGTYARYKQIGEYAGMTLLSVLFFVFLGGCFLRDPIGFIFAFGTGCPCCLICCPCVRAFTDKYLDAKKVFRENMNRYMPGVIVKEDGSLDFYEPSFDEITILKEIIEELSGESLDF